MLEHFYESSRHLQQLRQPPFAESINALAGRLHPLGYRKKYGRRILWVVGKFNDYARTIGIKSAEEVNESLLQHFVDEGLTHEQCGAVIREGKLVIVTAVNVRTAPDVPHSNQDRMCFVFRNNDASS